MAYVVKVKYDNGLVLDTYFQYKENALASFHRKLKEAGAISLEEEDKIPMYTEFKGIDYSIRRITWSDNADHYFVFIDDEDNLIFVMGDEEMFKDAYVKLQNKYRKNGWGFSDFYDKLAKSLRGKWVTINPDVWILTYQWLNFEQK